MATSTTSKTREDTIGEIGRLQDELDLPDSVQKLATQTFTQVDDTAEPSVLVGNGPAKVAAAYLYYAARVQHEPVKITHVAAETIVSEPQIRSLYTRLLRDFDLPTPPQAPTTFVPSIADAVDAPTEMVTAVKQLLAAVPETELNGRDPAGVAAGAFYAVANAADHPDWTTTQSVLTQAADVCTVTVRSRWLELDAYTDAITETLPDELPDHNTTDSDMTETTDTTDSIATNDTTPDMSSDSAYHVRLDGDTRTYETGTEMLADVVGVLITRYDLLDVIDIPYRAPRCARPLIVTDPDAHDITANWTETWVAGYYVDGKIGNNAKCRRLRQLADCVDIDIEIQT